MHQLKSGNTLLHLACFAGNLQSVSTILKSSDKKNITDKLLEIKNNDSKTAIERCDTTCENYTNLTNVSIYVYICNIPISIVITLLQKLFS